MATDYRTRKLKNLRESRLAAILVDSGVTSNVILISRPVEIIEKGKEYQRLYKLFYSRLDWVKRDPWKEGEAPFIKITPTFKAGWNRTADRKSTRLNSSHITISYAVFCLKKKIIS